MVLSASTSGPRHSLSQLSLEKKCFQRIRVRRNEERDSAEVTLGGNAFHARAPGTGNARSPMKTGVWRELRHRYWRPNAVSGEMKSRTRA